MIPKPVLFIDRDGTILIEPPSTFQIDTLSKFQFLPNVIVALHSIASLGNYNLVLVTNQDGLGRAQYPMESFEPYQQLMLDVLHSQGVKFFDIHIDCTTDEENAPTRKPRTGMLHKYLNNPDMFDIQNSFVIGDRRTDVQLAKNLGCQSILIENDLHLDYNNTITSEEEEYIALKVRDWKVISQFLVSAGITRTSKRVTNETTIAITVRNPGIGKYSIETGLPFFNHMLEQLAKHSGLDISIEATGDLDIEAHHLIEDVGIVLGEILNASLGSKIGIERYGFSLPMDESSANVQIDVGGRPSFRFEGTFSRSEINGFPTEMVAHFFESLAMNAKWNVHITVTGENDHHKIESVFKAFAKSIAMSLKKTDSTSVASTKGLL